MNDENELKKSSISLSGLVIGGFMIALAGFLVGGYGGSQIVSSYLQDISLKKHTNNTQVDVQVLLHLQSGEIPQAIELMESQLNDNLIVFAPKVPYEGLSDQTKIQIADAIRVSKDYREKYPRKQINATDTMVKMLFERTQ